jgi:hypothetical protein
MAAPTYAEDLTDIDLAEATTAWAESSDAAWDDGGGPTADSDYPYIEGARAISQTMTKATICSLLVDAGVGGISLPTDGAFLVWQVFSSPLVLDYYANGGMRVMVGSGLGDFYSWDVGGRDFGRNPYGGWQNHAVNPAIGSPDDTVGTPGATRRYIGAACKVTAGIAKGNPHAVDAVRYGRCEARFTNGESGTPCTFAGYAASNDASTACWGLIQAIPGGYLWKGLMTIGYSSAAYFSDSDKLVIIDNTPKVTTAFNKIEVRQAGTTLNWTRITFQKAGSVSKGRFEMIDAADVNLESCTFIDMDTFVFLSSGSALNCAWTRCAQITAPCPLNGSKILLSTVAADASALVWNSASDPDGYLDDMTFSKGTNAHHAIQFGTSAPTTMTLRGTTTSGFNASNAQNDSTFYFADKGSDTVWSLSVIGGTGNFSYKKARAGDTVVITLDSVTTKITVKNTSGTNIESARVLVEASDGTGDLPYNDTVTIARSSSTATVSHTAHGLATGDKVVIRYANQQEYNGVFSITYIGVDSYSYTVSGTPTTPATGTIKATGVVLEGLTDPVGVISASRVFSVDQNVKGTARKTTSSPYYKISDFTDIVDSVAGLTKIVQLVSDY